MESPLVIVVILILGKEPTQQGRLDAITALRTTILMDHLVWSVGKGWIVQLQGHLWIIWRWKRGIGGLLQALLPSLNVLMRPMLVGEDQELEIVFVRMGMKEFFVQSVLQIFTIHRQQIVASSALQPHPPP